MTEEMKLQNQELIKKEVEKLIAATKERVQAVKRIAVDEAWKILQLALASIIQIIEAIGNDLAGVEKKALAMQLINKFYDSVFIIVDIPMVPPVLESFIHKYVKAFLMILAGASIDALVTTFRNTGVFLKQKAEGTV